MKKMSVADWIAFFFVTLGALNMGLAGFFSFDIIAIFFGGPGKIPSKIVYALFVIAALYMVYFVMRENQDK
jgi:uncharacterized protein